jgi:hypothetical protein
LSLDEAIGTIKKDGFSNIIGEYISTREKTILEEVKKKVYNIFLDSLFI